MDYEKEYKKLKAGIEEAYLFAQTDSTKAVLEHILPELCESEDEKIIKFLKKCVQQPMGTNFLGDINKADVLAWLEKQKQKGEFDIIDFNCLNTCKKAIEAYRKIEEDKYGVTFPYYDQALIWLDSLEIRIQPKPALGEEDKKKLNRIYQLIAEAANEHAFSTTCRLIGDKECVELQDFLKSLKQRHTWKPSKEQMTALSEASGIVGMFTPRGTNLQSLYNDLQKLK